MEIRLRADIARLQRDMDAARQTVSSATSGMARAADAAKAALAGIGLGMGLAQVIQMSDQYAKFTAQLRLATNSAREYAAAYSDVKRIATSAQADLAATGTLYARIANGTRELGISQSKVADIVESVNMALKVSGATTQESASAILQLSQAFGSGALRGEEFNAVNEAAPRLMKALADGMGVPVGALKKMASDGLITSKVMAEVLPDALSKLRVEATQVQTISGAFQVLKNNVMEFSAVHSEANGTVAILTRGIGLLANNLTLLMGVLSTLTAVKLGTWAAEWVTTTYRQVTAAAALRAATVATIESELASASAKITQATATNAMILVAREEALAKLASSQANIVSAETAIAAATAAGTQSFALRTLRLATAELSVAEAGRAAMIAELAVLGQQQARVSAQLTAATAAQAAAQTALNGASGAGVAAAGLGARALGFLGGPIGMIITLLGLAATAWSVWGNKSKEATTQAAESFDEAQKRIVKGLDEQIEKNEKLLRLRSAGLTVTESEKKLPMLDQLAAASNRLTQINQRTGEFAMGKGMSNDDVILARAKILNDIADLNVKMAKAEQSGAAVASGTRADQLKQWYGENGTKAQQLAAELEKLKKQFGEIPSEMEKLVRAKFADKGAESAIKQEENAYKSLMTSIEQKIAANVLEKAGYESMSDAQKMTIKLDAEIATGKNKLTKGDIERARARIAVVAAEDMAIARSKAMAQIQAEYAAGLGKSVEEANREAMANEDLVKTFGMTKTAIIELEIVRMEERVERLRGIDMADDEVAALELVIAAKKRSAAALGSVDSLEAAKKATDDQIAEGKRLGDSIQQSLTDGLMRGFESGKSYGQNLIDTLKNMFGSLVLRPIISAIVSPVAGGLTGAFGLTGAANAAGTGGVAGSNSLIGMAQAASGIYKAISGGFASLSTTVADTVQAGMYGTGMTDQILTNSAFANSVGSATASAAGAVAGHYIGNAIAGDYSVAHGQTVTNVASVIGAVMGGPIGGAIGGAIGGLINRAFGMGSTELKSQGISGTLSSSGLTGSSYQNLHQDGGWFRSDKNWTDTKAFSTEMVAQFTQGFDAIKTASAGFASALGASVDSIASYSKDFNITLTGDAEANKKAVADFFNGVGDEIALRLVPNLAQFSKTGETVSATLERLAGDFQATNQVAMLMGVSGKTMFGSLGVESAAARERLIELAGGVSNLSTQANTFAQNYLTEAERLAPVSEAVAAAMASLGLASVTTREQFKTVVQGLDVTTAAGAQQFASMMALADSFAQVHPLIEATTAAMRTEADILSERKDLQKQFDQATMTSAQLRAKERLAIDSSNLALFDQITNLQTIAATSDALKTSIDKLKTFKDGILSFRDSLTLGSLSTLNPQQKLAEAQRQYEDMLAKANAGDATARAGIQGAITAYLTADQVVNASNDKFVNDAMKVQADLMALADAAGAQISVDQLQLTALDNQVSQMVTLNATVEGLRADNSKLREDNAKLLTAVQEQTAVLATVITQSADANAATVNQGAKDAATSRNWKLNLDAEAVAQ